MGLTAKQNQLMAVIIAGNDDGSAADVDQILERLPYDTTKQSIQFSFRALVAKGCIERESKRVLRRGKSRVTYIATSYGQAFFTAPSGTAFDPTEEIEVPDVYLGLDVE